MAKAPNPTVQAVAQVLKQAYPHHQSLRTGLAPLDLPYLHEPERVLLHSFAEDLQQSNLDRRWLLLSRLMEHRSLYSLSWLDIARGLADKPVQLADFRFAVNNGQDLLLDRIGGLADLVLGHQPDLPLFHDLCALRIWIQENPLRGSPENQIQQFRERIQRFRRLFLCDILQAHHTADPRTVDRVISELPVYYCSFSRAAVWLDERPGPAGRAELAELSANLSRLQAPVYRMLWVTEDELRSGAARQAAFYIWVLTLEAACNDRVTADARWRLVDPRNPDPRPFAVLQDEQGQRRLGKRGGLLSTRQQQGRSCPHHTSAFQGARPIEDLLRWPIEALPKAA